MRADAPPAFMVFRRHHYVTVIIIQGRKVVRHPHEVGAALHNPFEGQIFPTDALIQGFFENWIFNSEFHLYPGALPVSIGSS